MLNLTKLPTLIDEPGVRRYDHVGVVVDVYERFIEAILRVFLVQMRFFESFVSNFLFSALLSEPPI